VAFTGGVVGKKSRLKWRRVSPTLEMPVKKGENLRLNVREEDQAVTGAGDGVECDIGANGLEGFVQLHALTEGDIRVLVAVEEKRVGFQPGGLYYRRQGCPWQL